MPPLPSNTPLHGDVLTLKAIPRQNVWPFQTHAEGCQLYANAVGLADPCSICMPSLGNPALLEDGPGSFSTGLERGGEPLDTLPVSA